MNQQWSRLARHRRQGARPQQCETCYLWFMGPDRQIVGEVALPGRVDAVTLPLDAIARAIIGLNASYLFMAHNHPSGDARPSAQDIAATRQVWRTARAVGASLQDHYVFGRTGFFSFRDNGLL